MKTAQEMYPGDGFYGPGDYTPIIEAIGDVLVREDDSDYQGNTLVLLKKNDRYGYCRIGWGSCSGCDSLQACSSYAEIQKLAEEIEAGVRWFASPAEGAAFFAEYDWDGEWAAQPETRARFIAKGAAALALAVTP